MRISVVAPDGTVNNLNNATKPIVLKHMLVHVNNSEQMNNL